MQLKSVSFCLLILLSTMCIERSAALAQSTVPPQYQSPYAIKFTVPFEELCAIDREPPRNDKTLESTAPYEEWYSNRILKNFGPWGPRPRHYSVIDSTGTIPNSWKRQRVLAVAYKLIGLPYQHHHIPDWDPPDGWPWKPVALGRNSKGLDCSNFTSWIYNYGLGIHINADVHKQAESSTAGGPNSDDTIELRVIRDDKGYDDLVRKLRTGDLLYIKSKNSCNVSHVIMWVGEFGQSPDGTPLVIDSTGSDRHDCNGKQIPLGVHLRPFTRDSWYYNSLSHAHRIIGE
jgi:cell wall-associated NlpC family hydrolase